MSVPSEALKSVIAGGAGAVPPRGAVNPLGDAAKANSPPSPGPITTPQPKEGLEQEAMIDISIALDLIEKAIPAFGSETPKGKALMTALKQLGGLFGEDRQKAQPLIPAQIAQLMQKFPGAGGGNPAAKAIGAIPPGMPAVQGAAPPQGV